MIAGIDPGYSGCIVYLKDNGEYVSHTHLSNKPTVYANEIMNMNGEFAYRFVAVEHVHALFGSSAKGTFNFGEAFGMARALASCLSRDVVLVRPTEWKKHFKLGKEKDHSRLLALTMYDIPDLNKKGKGQALADAILIARYANEMRSG